MTVQELIDTLQGIKNKDVEIVVENVDYPESPFEIRYFTMNPDQITINLFT